MKQKIIPLLGICLILALVFAVSAPGTSYAQILEVTPDPGVDSEGSVLLPAPLMESEPAGETCNDPNLIFCSAPAVNWQQVSSLPVAVYGAAVVTDGYYLYVIGGGDGSPSDQFLRYNPAANIWTALPNLPVASLDGMAFYLDGKIYYVGGFDLSVVQKTVYIYSFVTGTWTSGADMPEARHQMGGGIYNHKIYVAGGYLTNELPSVRNQLWEYDPALNSWSAKTTMPIGVSGPASGVFGYHLYILGGRKADGASLNTVYIYDFLSDTWSTGANMPTAVNYPASVVYNSHIWLMGGGNPFMTGDTGVSNDPQALGVTQIYDPIRNTWAYGPNQILAKSFHNGAVIGQSIYTVGGFASGASYLVERLTQKPMKILIIYADAHVAPAKLRMDLLATPGVGQVDVMNGQTISPTSAHLLNYDLVAAFSNGTYANPDSVGTALANYLSGGGIVVEMPFNFSSGYAPGGLWAAGNYSPYITSTNKFSEVTLSLTGSTHPLFQDVSTLTAYYHTTPDLSINAVSLASWSDYTSAVAVKDNVVAINAYLGDYSGRWGGDFAQIIVNAGNWLWRGNMGCERSICNDPIRITDSLGASDATQTSRLLRDDPENTCAAPQSCSVYASTDVVRYNAYAFINNSDASQCVNVTVVNESCGTVQLQSATYLNSYDPNNLCANFLGDIGSTVTGTNSYSVTVPAWTKYTVVVNTVNPAASCSTYQLIVEPGECPIKKIALPAVFKYIGLRQDERVDE
ncbi:MAG TPA: kelch repeat-containing protein [Anaerolineaceae bacterium]|nr:kelch repeat-containing protein [Anaerolineaceae bacterium]HPN51920.1 kelch repeat-containing protein [Anaerolineaceae bacterium]